MLGSSRPSTYAGGGSAILCFRQVREPGLHPALEVRRFALGFAFNGDTMLTIETRPIARLIPYVRNARTHSGDQSARDTRAR